MVAKAARRLVGGLAIAMLSTLGLGPAWASCAVPPGSDQMIAEARTVFVGTVEAVTNERRWASVRVEEVWKGPDLPRVVEVHGSDASRPGAGTSVDRTYLVATRYLFVLHDDTLPLSDNACTGTQEWRDELAEHRPAQVREPVPRDAGAGGQTDPAAARSGVGPIALMGVAAGLVGVLLAVRWLRRSG